jgi:hypothetical protein
MPYPALTDLAIPYHLDGSVVKLISPTTGVVKTFTADEMLCLNDEDATAINYPSSPGYKLVVFFPELVAVTAIYAILINAWGKAVIGELQGSADSTNGWDGTWVNATMPNGYNSSTDDFDSWRKSIVPVQSLSSVKVIKFTGGGDYYSGIEKLHIYGHKVAGQTPNDILFLDAENSDAEFATPLDYGDRPSGTSVIRQIKLKNSSATLQAGNVDLTVVDPVDVIRISLSDTGTWVTTLNFASIAAGAKTAVIYVKCETPAPPTPLGPDRAPIKVTVGAWT